LFRALVSLKTALLLTITFEKWTGSVKWPVPTKTNSDGEAMLTETLPAGNGAHPM